MSKSRFKLVPAGRRSGKTERAKRYVVHEGYKMHNNKSWSDPRYFFAAPTREQAKAIYWNDLKALISQKDIFGKPNETELKIRLINGTEFCVLGVDRPERIEGRPWDGGILDEYANMRSDVWAEHIRPALSDREGWAWLIGVPEGRNHYYDLVQKALLDSSGEWDVFSWKSSTVLSKREIESVKRDLDPLTFDQEFNASFITFAGRIYYQFDSKIHVGKLKYSDTKPLIFTFDFNISPGIAVILQEQMLPCGNIGTGVIGEVYIPKNSTTPAVCEKLIKDWGNHLGIVKCYGDATGGSGGTAKVMGSDWDLIKNSLFPVFSNRLEIKVLRSNPRERIRVNALNARLLTLSGDVRMMVDYDAKHVIKDFEGVRVSSLGGIDKKSDPNLSHITDAIGYYIHQVFPISGGLIRGSVGGMY